MHDNAIGSFALDLRQPVVNPFFTTEEFKAKAWKVYGNYRYLEAFFDTTCGLDYTRSCLLYMLYPLIDKEKVPLKYCFSKLISNKLTFKL